MANFLDALHASPRCDEPLCATLLLPSPRRSWQWLGARRQQPGSLLMRGSVGLQVAVDAWPIEPAAARVGRRLRRLGRPQLSDAQQATGSRRALLERPTRSAAQADAVLSRKIHDTAVWWSHSGAGPKNVNCHDTRVMFKDTHSAGSSRPRSGRRSR